MLMWNEILKSFCPWKWDLCKSWSLLGQLEKMEYHDYMYAFFLCNLEYKVLKINLLSTGNKIDLEKERHVSVQEAEM